LDNHDQYIVANNPNEELARISAEVLSSLGEPTIHAVHKEMIIDEDQASFVKQFDIVNFDGALREIFGNDAEQFMSEISFQFEKIALLQKYVGENSIREICNMELLAVGRILQILALAINVDDPYLF